MERQISGATLRCRQIQKAEGEAVNRLTLTLAALLAFSVISASAFGQGCASCYTSAAAGGPQTAHALRSGILLLLFPPTLIFASIIVTLRRWRTGDRMLSNIVTPQGEAESSAANDVRTK